MNKKDEVTLEATSTKFFSDDLEFIRKYVEKIKIEKGIQLTQSDIIRQAVNEKVKHLKKDINNIF
jgi:hypothetical protein